MEQCWGHQQDIESYSLVLGSTVFREVLQPHPSMLGLVPSYMVAEHRSVLPVPKGDKEPGKGLLARTGCDRTRGNGCELKEE